ncbi:WD repeat-containing protein 61 [Agrocybe pediades]|nr:WD repeat-containing protein 61 [Agrocybe pediades]
MSLAFLHAHDCTEPHTDAIWGLHWTPSDTVISISADGSIKQHLSATGQPHPPNSPFPAAHSLAQVSLSVSPDGKRALYNSIEGLTRLWNLETGEVDASFESYASGRGGKEDGIEPSWSVSLNPLGGTYASTGSSGNVTIHSAQIDNFGERQATLPSGRNKFGMFCSYSPDGKRIALSTENGQIFVFDTETNALAFTFTSHAMSVRSLAWSPDSTLLLSASEDKRLILHDVRSAPGGAVASFSGHTSWVLSADISHDGRLGLSGSADKTIKVWDIAARACVSTMQDTSEVWAVSWRPKAGSAAAGPNGAVNGAGAGTGAFVSGGEDGVVKWWRGAGGA